MKISLWSPNPLIQFNFNNQIHNYNLRNRNNLHVVNLGQNLNLLRKRFITHNGCIIFNELPITLRNIVNNNTFKINVKKHLLSAYWLTIMTIVYLCCILSLVQFISFVCQSSYLRVLLTLIKFLSIVNMYYI